MFILFQLRYNTDLSMMSSAFISRKKSIFLPAYKCRAHYRQVSVVSKLKQNAYMHFEKCILRGAFFSSRLFRYSDVFMVFLTFLVRLGYFLLINAELIIDRSVLYQSWNKMPFIWHAVKSCWNKILINGAGNAACSRKFSKSLVKFFICYI